MTKIKGDISRDIEIRLKKGEALTKLLKQDRGAPVAIEEQIILLYALRQHILDDLPKLKFDLFKEKIFAFTRQNNPDLVKSIAHRKELNDKIKDGLNESFKEFFYTQGGEAGVVKS
jgi:F-type H+/Na+-transporting ATPase subunit alpha